MYYRFYKCIRSTTRIAIRQFEFDGRRVSAVAGFIQPRRFAVCFDWIFIDIDKTEILTLIWNQCEGKVRSPCQQFGFDSSHD